MLGIAVAACGFFAPAPAPRTAGRAPACVAAATNQLAQPWYRNDDVDYYHQMDHEYNGRDSTNFMKPGLNLT